MSDERPSCLSCGKLLFKDDPFEGRDDWYACRNVTCMLYDLKLRKLDKDDENKNKYEC